MSQQHTTRTSHFRARIVPHSPKPISFKVPARNTGSPISSPLRRAVKKHLPSKSRATAISFVDQETQQREVLIGSGEIFEKLKSSMRAQSLNDTLRLEELIKAQGRKHDQQIQLLKEEIVGLKEENAGLKEENTGLKGEIVRLQGAAKRQEEKIVRLEQSEARHEQEIVGLKQSLNIVTNELQDSIRDSKPRALVAALRYIAKTVIGKSSHEPTSTLQHHLVTALENQPTKLREDFRENVPLRLILNKRTIRTLAESCDVDKRNSDAHLESQPASLILTLSKLEDLVVLEAGGDPDQHVESLALKMVLGAMGPAAAKEAYGMLLQRSCPPSAAQQERVSRYLEA